MSVVVAVDGGGSKTDVVVARAADGRELARLRGPGCSHQVLGAAAAAGVVDRLVTAALADAAVGPGDVVTAGCYLTSIDLDVDWVAMHDALVDRAWARGGLVVDNDVFAMLRAGTEAADAAVVVCGTGINGAAIRADGATARIPALGRVSGDWGGGAELVEEVLWHAARAEDGRGQPTALRDALLRWTGRSSVHDVVVDLHQGRLSAGAWWSRVPEVMALAQGGDAVARRLVERQGEEIGVLAGSLLARLELAGRPVHVVVGGGIGASADPLLMAAVHDALDPRAPEAEIVVCTRPPVDGALLLVLAGTATR